MKLETLEALQALLNELNSVVNTYTGRGYDHQSLDDAFCEADDVLEKEIKIKKAIRFVDTGKNPDEADLPEFLKRQSL